MVEPVRICTRYFADFWDGFWIGNCEKTRECPLESYQLAAESFHLEGFEMQEESNRM